MSHTRSLAALVLLLALTMFATVACSGLRAQARSGGSNSKQCSSCERMCEVAGEDGGDSGAVDKCKADCQKKCS